MAAGGGFDMSTLMPGMNPSGTNQAVPTTGGNPMPAMGGGTNPFLPSFSSGTNMPGISNAMYRNPSEGGFGGPPSAPGGSGAISMSGQPASSPIPGAGGGGDINALIQQILSGGFAANGVSGPIGGAMGGAAGSAAGGAGGMNPASSIFGTGNWSPNQNDFVKAMHKAGISAGDAALLFNFIQSGGGFNQGQINNLLQQTFAAQQPQIARGEADLLEHFGSMGLGMSSPAAIGLGDYLSQISLGQGQLAAQEEFGGWNQGIQNILSVLMAGKGQPPQNMFQNLMQYLQTSANVAGAAGFGAG